MVLKFSFLLCFVMLSGLEFLKKFEHLKTCLFPPTQMYRSFKVLSPPITPPPPAYWSPQANTPIIITESQNGRGLEGTSVDHLVQPPCQSRVTYSRLHRTLSRQVLNISREGDSTTSLGSLFQGSAPSERRSSSLCSAGTSSASVCAHCPLSCCWAPPKRI